MSYFPMFIELKDRPCLVAGGGKIARRKAETLRDYGARVTVAAPDVLPEIRAMEGVVCLEKQFDQSDLAGQVLVVAATDDPEQNHRISQACREAGIPVNAVDQKEDCSFIFPAYLKEGEVVAAFSSGGQSPVVAQYLKEQMRPVMTPLLGELAEALAGLRNALKQPGMEDMRKKLCREILELGLDMGGVPGAEQVGEMIKKMQEGGNNDGKNEKAESEPGYAEPGAGKSSAGG